MTVAPRAIWPGFTRTEWFRIPLPLRARWWRETNYGKVPPSTDLAAAIAKALDRGDAPDGQDQQAHLGAGPAGRA